MSRARHLSLLALVLVLAVGGVVTFAAWDGRQVAVETLEDLGAHQARIAGAIGVALEARLASLEREMRIATNEDPPSTVLLGVAVWQERGPDDPVAEAPLNPPSWVVSIPRGDGQFLDVTVPIAHLLGPFAFVSDEERELVLLRAPNDAHFRALDGSEVVVPALEASPRGGSVRVGGAEAHRLGLPPRTAFAGMASVDGGAFGTWTVAVIGSAEREREREDRALARMVLLVASTVTVLLLLATFVVRRQRRELDLERALSISKLERRQEERLERAMRAATLGTIAMGVTHELSTPLSVIAGRANQLLERAKADERGQVAARAILDQTNRIIEVVHGFLALTRGVDPSAQAIAPAELVTDAIALVGHRMRKSGVAVDVTVDDGISAVHGNRRLLEHALVNLLVNAADACEEGGSIAIHAHQEESTVRFDVVDDGIGIPSEQAARIPQIFFTTKAEGAGSGLGLAIVQEIARGHHGGFSIEPVVPHGTRASIWLPAEAP